MYYFQDTLFMSIHTLKRMNIPPKINKSGKIAAAYQKLVAFDIHKAKQ